MTDLTAIPDRSQDLVFSTFAFGYVDDMSACFSEARRVLADDGWFVWSRR